MSDRPSLATWLERHVDGAYTLLRVVAGLLFMFHGMQKLFGVASDFMPKPPSQLWFGGIIELTTGLLMASGTFTRCAALLASGTMAVAYLQFHWKLDVTSIRFFPAVNKGELALLNAFTFLFFFFRGGGPFSVDALLARRTKK